MVLAQDLRLPHARVCCICDLFEEGTMREKSAILGATVAAAFSLASFSGAFAAPCATGSATTYLSDGANANCTVGNETISNFFWPTTGNVPASAVTVTPVVTAGAVGLTFSSANFAADSVDIALNPNFSISGP